MSLCRRWFQGATVGCWCFCLSWWSWWVFQRFGFGVSFGRCWSHGLAYEIRLGWRWKLRIGCLRVSLGTSRCRGGGRVICQLVVLGIWLLLADRLFKTCNFRMRLKIGIGWWVALWVYELGIKSKGWLRFKDFGVFWWLGFASAARFL